jgi:hypothetical protein
VKSFIESLFFWNTLESECVFLAAIANVYWHETRTNCKYIPTKTQTPGYLVTSFDPKMLFWKWTAICGELLKRMQQLFGNPQCTMFVLSWKNKPIGHHCQSVINEISPNIFCIVSMNGLAVAYTIGRAFFYCIYCGHDRKWQITSWSSLADTRAGPNAIIQASNTRWFFRANIRILVPRKKHHQKQH